MYLIIWMHILFNATSLVLFKSSGIYKNSLPLWCNDSEVCLQFEKGTIIVVSFSWQSQKGRDDHRYCRMSGSWASTLLLEKTSRPVQRSQFERNTPHLGFGWYLHRPTEYLYRWRQRSRYIHLVGIFRCGCRWPIVEVWRSAGIQNTSEWMWMVETDKNKKKHRVWTECSDGSQWINRKAPRGTWRYKITAWQHIFP